MSSNKLYVRLINLRNDSGNLLYERLKLARTLLADREWVEAAEHGGGNESVAIDRLEAEAFADVCGAMSLPQMLEILRAVPQATVWKANKFNLRRMYAEMRERETPTPTPTPTQTAPVQDRRDVKIAELKQELQAAREEVKTLRQENSRLHQRLDRIQKLLGAETSAA